MSYPAPLPSDGAALPIHSIVTLLVLLSILIPVVQQLAVLDAATINVHDTTALNGEFDFELENGHIQTHTGSTAGTYFPDFRVSSSTSLSSVMGVGDVISCTLIVAAPNTAHYCTTGIKIDNSTSNVTIEWIGSAAPSEGKGAGYDLSLIHI